MLGKVNNQNEKGFQKFKDIIIKIINFVILILMRLKRSKKNRKFSLTVRAQDSNVRTYPEGLISVDLKLKKQLTERREKKH